MRILSPRTWVARPTEVAFGTTILPVPARLPAFERRKGSFDFVGPRSMDSDLPFKQEDGMVKACPSFADGSSMEVGPLR
jgi:hypothetical protein